MEKHVAVWFFALACIACGVDVTQGAEVDLQQQALGATWVFCAPEGRTCRVPNGSSVRYGANGQFFTLTATNGSLQCDNPTFGGDPVAGVVKTCEAFLERRLVGEWGPLQDLQVTAVHATLLPNGKVLAHDATNHHIFGPSALPRVWDPTNGSVSGELDAHGPTDSELFCVGFDLLPDGSLLTSGNQPNVHADTGAANIDRNSNRFDFRTQTFSRVADMNRYRYYPSQTVLPSGDMVSFSGLLGDDPLEIFNFDGTWEELSGAHMAQNFNYYAWGQTAPNGKFYYLGPDYPDLHAFDTTGAGSKQTFSVAAAGTTDRHYGSYAMYTTGKVLVVGGGGTLDLDARYMSSQVVANPLKTAFVIDLNPASPTAAATGDMAVARRHHNATILANGQVLVTGGHSNDAPQGQHLAAAPSAVHSAELWNPSTGVWSTLSSQLVERLYHSVAILLPDGRVLAAGGGMPFTDDPAVSKRNGQVFSPPYLFNSSNEPAARPAISYAPDSISYGGSFIVKSDQAATITKAHLIKLGAVTHAQNFGQRLVPLTITGNANNTLTVSAPSNPNLAPPGYYMLFIVNSSGVPSTAAMIQVQPYPTLRIISRLNGKSIEVEAASQNAASPRVQMRTTDEALGQMWQLVPTTSGYFKLISRLNGKPLSVPGSSGADGVALSTLGDTGATSQQWQFTQGSNGYFEIHPRHNTKSLTVQNAQTGDGTLAIQQTDTNASHQEWQILPVGWVNLAAVESGKILDVWQAAQADTQLVQHRNVGTLNQAWSFQPTSDGWATITARHSNKVVDVWNASTADAAAVYQATLNGGPNQQWRLIPNPDASFKVQVRHSQKFLNVGNHLLTDAAPIIQYPDNGGLPNMMWRVVAAQSGQPFSVSTGGGLVVYRAHVANQGWQRWVSSTQVAGVTGQSIPMEAVEINVSGVRPGLNTQYRAHVRNTGWQGWVGNKATAGTVGQSLPMEAIEIQLTGSRTGCSVSYRAHVQNVGWQAWVNEGQTAGTVGESKNLEALQIRVECL